MHPRRFIWLSVIVSLQCFAGEPPADDAAELRRACFEYLEARLAVAPVKDVPWANKQRLTFDKIDLAKETLSSNSGGLAVDLKFKKVANDELISLLRSAAGAALARDAKAAVLTAALYAVQGQPETAQALIDAVLAEDLSVEVRYKLWIKKLGLEKKEPPKSPEPLPAQPNVPATSPTNASSALPVGPSVQKHPVAKEHPRLLGSRARLQALAAERPEAFKNTLAVARKTSAPDFVRVPSMALAAAVGLEAEFGKSAVQLAMKLVNGPIRVGHETFGHDLALCALVYDLCYASWSAEERAKFIEYMNKTVEANVNSEVHVFANGYYGYKNWGIGLACYATMYENPKAAEYLQRLDTDIRGRAAPAMELCGDGGGWAEGHYVHYWTYEWLFFCEVARLCEGVDYFPTAPKFYSKRAIASIFEMYPGATPPETNAPVPMGDGGYGVWGGYSEKILAARRMLVNYYRNDPAHQAVNTYNQFVNGNFIPEYYAYMDFLWNDRSVPKADLKNFKLSHFSAGPGYVAARSSWDGDATYLFFRCGRRFTSHQHLDVGHFLIFKHAQLAGDGGVYDSFCSDHCCNYYLRAIAHNTMLVYDPAEKFPSGIRAFATIDNDGGQDYPWIPGINHNGGFLDAEHWNKNRKAGEIAEMLAYDDQRSFVYAAGDCTRAYSNKIDCFTRQIVFLRPGTLVVFDRVQAKSPAFKKTWLLHAMRVPTGTAPNLIVTNGKGRLFVQTVLPAKPVVKLCSGAELHSYGGKNHPPAKDVDDVPTCRIEISPSVPAAADCFLHVLTATEASVQSVPQADAKVTGSDVTVSINGATLKFLTASVGGSVTVGGQTVNLASKTAGN